MEQQNQNIQTAPIPVPVRKWGGKETLTLIFLIFLPIVGLILTWTITNWSKKAKIIVTIIFLIIPAIAVIGILSTITLVSLSDVREDARDAKITSDMRIISITQEMYFSQNGRYIASIDYPAGEVVSFEMPTSPGGVNYEWINNLLDDQGFCAYAQLSDNTFMIANQIGVGTKGSEPKNLLDCAELDL
jgi:type II secretory pathway pseudopilin PulG